MNPELLRGDKGKSPLSFLGAISNFRTAFESLCPCVFLNLTVEFGLSFPPKNELRVAGLARDIQFSLEYC